MQIDYWQMESKWCPIMSNYFSLCALGLKWPCWLVSVLNRAYYGVRLCTQHTTSQTNTGMEKNKNKKNVAMETLIIEKINKLMDG